MVYTGIFGKNNQQCITYFGQEYSRNKAKGQGHSDPKMVCNTLLPHEASTNQTWDSYLK